jgi:hypothetical protein
MGKVFNDCESKRRLKKANTNVIALGSNLVKPAVYFKLTAKAISKAPAVKTYNQDIRAAPLVVNRKK